MYIRITNCHLHVCIYQYIHCGAEKNVAANFCQQL